MIVATLISGGPNTGDNRPPSTELRLRVGTALVDVLVVDWVPAGIA